MFDRHSSSTTFIRGRLIVVHPLIAYFRGRLIDANFQLKISCDKCGNKECRFSDRNILGDNPQRPKTQEQV